MADNDPKIGEAEEDKVKVNDESNLLDADTDGAVDESVNQEKSAGAPNSVENKPQSKKNKNTKSNSKDEAVGTKLEVLEEVDESQLGVLTESLLSTGEDMSKLLKATNSLTDRLKDVSNRYSGLVNSYDHLIKKKDKHLLYLMASSIGVIVISLALVVVMSFSFSKQVNNMNALSMSLTKRIAEVNSGLVTFEELNASIRALDESTLQLAQQVEAQQKKVQDVADQIGIDTRDQIEQSKLLLSEQMNSLGTTVTALQRESQNQQYYVNQNSTAVQGLQSELEVMRGSVGQLIALKNSVDALVVLERERYIEAIQSKSTETIQSATEDDGVISFYTNQN
jgi:predicted  nucleic acid-binding Zn-ribbon protein